MKKIIARRVESEVPEIVRFGRRKLWAHYKEDGIRVAEANYTLMRQQMPKLKQMYSLTDRQAREIEQSVTSMMDKIREIHRRKQERN